MEERKENIDIDNSITVFIEEDELLNELLTEEEGSESYDEAEK